MKARRTQRKIDDIRTRMSKRALDSQDSDSSAGRPTSWGPMTHGPPTPRGPPPPSPPLPSGPPRLVCPQSGRVGGQATRSPLRSVRREKPDTIKTEEPRRRFEPTDIPSFNPSIPPPRRGDCVSNNAATQSRALTERESNRPRLRLPETFPRSAKQTREDKEKALRGPGQAQTWTTTVYGLADDDRTQKPQQGMCRVSPIQCSICATHRIPALLLCYRCFPEIALNQIVSTDVDEWKMNYKCKICFTRRSTCAEICLHGSRAHIPQEHVDFRYPFTQAELGVIASKDKDRYNREVRPRSLPLRDGICILRESPPSDQDGATRSNWYDPSPDHPTTNKGVPLPDPPRPENKPYRTSSSLDCQLCTRPGCTMLCGNAAMEAITSIAKATSTRFQMQQATNCSTGRGSGVGGRFALVRAT